MTIRTLRLSRLVFGRSYSSRRYRLKLIHSARIRRSTSRDMFGLSVTVPLKYLEERSGLGVFFFRSIGKNIGIAGVQRIVIISSKARDDRVTMHASLAHSIHHTARCAHSSAALGATLARYSWRWTRSVRMSASSLKHCSPTMSIAAKKMLKSKGDNTHPWRSPCTTLNPSEHVPSLFRTQALVTSWIWRIIAII